MSVYFGRIVRASSNALGVASVFASIAIVAPGCSKANSNRAQVSGKVVVDGTPAATGSIAFSPLDGASPTAGGKIVDGNYSVEAPIGASRVEIRVPKVIGERRLYDTPDSPVQPLMEESLPKEFNDESELTYEVKQGVNEQDFNLKTKQG
jgi:hypothetical protein